MAGSPTRLVPDDVQPGAPTSVQGVVVGKQMPDDVGRHDICDSGEFVGGRLVVRIEHCHHVGAEGPKRQIHPDTRRFSLHPPSPCEQPVRKSRKWVLDGGPCPNALHDSGDVAYGGLTAMHSASMSATQAINRA